MSAAEAGDEVIFERLNRSFGEVATVEACGGELVVDLFLEEIISHEIGDFIIHFVENGVVAASTEFGCDGCHGSEKTFLFAIGYGDGVNGIGVIVVQDKKVIVAGDGWADETTCLVGECVAGDLKFADVDVVGAKVNRVWLEFFSVGSSGGVSEGKRTGFGAFGGSNVGAM